MAALAEIAAQYDADGIDVYFLNSRKEGLGMKVGSLRPRALVNVSTDDFQRRAQRKCRDYSTVCNPMD